MENRQKLLFEMQVDFIRASKNTRTNAPSGRSTRNHSSAGAFSSPEPTILLACAGFESSGSNHFEITKEITEFCPSGFTAQSASMAHA